MSPTENVRIYSEVDQGQGFLINANIQWKLGTCCFFLQKFPTKHARLLPGMCCNIDYYPF